MIKLENVSFTYNKGRPDAAKAIDNVSLEIASGSVAALIGPTGSGKSTLIQMLNGLILPDSGRVTVNGTAVNAKDADLRALRFRVGMVFQYPERQLFAETVREDIAFGPENMGLDEGEVKARVQRAAELVGLSETELQRSPFELSGGQQRRAAIAGVLAMEPEVLVMDEPAAGLDPEGRARIFGLIDELRRKKPELTIIFVSHSMEDAAVRAERIVVVNEGRIAMEGSVGEVFSRAEELLEIGLDVPQITRLCMKLKGAGFALGDDIYTVEAAVRSIKRVLADA